MVVYIILPPGGRGLIFFKIIDIQSYFFTKWGEGQMSLWSGKFSESFIFSPAAHSMQDILFK